MADRSRPSALWIAGFAVVGLIAAWAFLPVHEWLDRFQAFVASLGFSGYLLFGAVYVIGTILLAPGLALTIAAALAFGLWALPLVIVAATLGATASFLIARYLARGTVLGFVEGRPTLQAVERAIADDGGKVVLLMRLSPLVPFNLQNYVFGVTGVGFWPYVAATLVGIIPGATAYVLLGAAGQAAGDQDHGWPFWALLGVGIVATIVVTVIVTKKARAKLAEAGVD